LVVVASNQGIIRKLFNRHSPLQWTVCCDIWQSHFTGRWARWGFCLKELTRWKISHIFL